MLSALSSSSTRITTDVKSSPCLFKCWSNPGLNRGTSRGCVEEPTQAQLKFNNFTAEALHGELSAAQRHANVTGEQKIFGRDSRLEDFQRSVSKIMDPQQTGGADPTDSEGWQNIQEYGQFLGEAANHFPFSPNGPSYPPPISFHTVPPPDNTTPQTSISSYISPFDWISWRQFQFNTEFSHLAPLDPSQDRTYAQQSANLSNWVANPANDAMFTGWQGLSQVADHQSISDETQRQREEEQQHALQQMLVVEGQQHTGSHSSATIGDGGWRPDPYFRGDPTQSPFAQYLTQEAPVLSSQLTEMNGNNDVQPSGNKNPEISEQDTQGIVSQDNHWRRTILG